MGFINLFRHLAGTIPLVAAEVWLVGDRDDDEVVEFVAAVERVAACAGVGLGVTSAVERAALVPQAW